MDNVLDEEIDREIQNDEIVKERKRKNLFKLWNLYKEKREAIDKVREKLDMSVPSNFLARYVLYIAEREEKRKQINAKRLAKYHDEMKDKDKLAKRREYQNLKNKEKRDNKKMMLLDAEQRIDYELPIKQAVIEPVKQSVISHPDPVISTLTKEIESIDLDRPSMRIRRMKF